MARKLARQPKCVSSTPPRIGARIGTIPMIEEMTDSICPAATPERTSRTMVRARMIGAAAAAAWTTRSAMRMPIDGAAAQRKLATT